MNKTKAAIARMRDLQAYSFGVRSGKSSAARFFNAHMVPKHKRRQATDRLTPSERRILELLDSAAGAANP